MKPVSYKYIIVLNFWMIVFLNPQELLSGHLWDRRLLPALYTIHKVHLQNSIARKTKLVEFGNDDSGYSNITRTLISLLSTVWYLNAEFIYF